MQAQNNQIKILLAEDSLLQAEMLKRVLIEQGFLVDHAGNGAEGLAKIRENCPDLVISDVIMPGMNGFELCRAIRADGSFKQLPFILLTSLSDTENVLAGLESGADNFITKPCNTSRLMDIIHSQLSKKTLQSSKEQDGLIVIHNNQPRIIKESPERILDFFLSTYEIALEKNAEMTKARAALEDFNETLEIKVQERAMALLAEAKQREEAEANLERSRLYQQLILEAVGEGIVGVDIKGQVTFANPAATRLMALEPHSLLGQFFDQAFLFFFPDGRLCPKEERPFFLTLRDGQRRDIEGSYGRQDGSAFLIQATCCAITEGEQITGAVISFKDITKRKKAEETVNFLSYNDPLTSLPNRTLFMDRARQSLASSRHSGNPVGLIVLNLDRFKFINETFGMETGDEVLRQAGHKLDQIMREGDTVARLGNDDFGIILADLKDAEDIVLVLEKIRQVWTKPIKVRGQELLLTCGMGIAIFPQDGKDAPTLLQNADSALSKAKELGGNRYQFYTAGMNAKAANYVLLGNQLLRALDRQEFLLHYQPYYQISTKKMVGMEALIRWQYPEEGLVSPGKFIPFLEDTGLIREVGEWTLKEVCRQQKEWLHQGYDVVPISVNFSAVQFGCSDLVAMVERVVGESGIDFQLLTAEVTESAIMEDVEYTKNVLARFKDLGMSISIDDFGTGYSSLSYLNRFPFDTVKIDITFIRELTTDVDSATIVQAIISMANSLNLKTIAEGVETKEQAQILRFLRCDIIQGFHYCRPLPAEKLTNLFKTEKPLARL